MHGDQAAAEAVGTTIADKYRLLRLLGAGGMGAVYEAEHVFTKRRVAVKRMLPSLARSKQAADRFIRESQAPSTIGHPGIVQVLDGGIEPDGSLYLVLELLDGLSMQDALDEGPLHAAAVTQIGIELLEALGAAHAKGFIHRDIKPDNVFLAQDGRGGIAVKLLDFGIASIRGTEGDDKLTRTGAVLGTPAYMSPEQAQGAPIDARSDLWAVGALLYRALAGAPPYDGDTYNALIVSIVTKQHAPLEHSRPDLPRNMLSVVERAMKKAPSERFQTAEQMCEALQIVNFDAHAQREDSDSSATRPVPKRVDAPGASLADSAAVSGVVRAAERPLRPASVNTGVAASTELPSSLLSTHAAATRPQERRAPLVARVEPATRASVSASRLAVAASLCLAIATGVFVLRGRQISVRDAAAQLPVPPSAALDEYANMAPGAAMLAQQERAAPAALPTNERAAEQVRDLQTDPENPTSDGRREPSPPATQELPVAPARAPAGLPREALATVLSEHEAELQHCLEEAVVAQMLAGAQRAEPLRLDVELWVAPRGSVERVEVQGRAPADLTHCVRTRLSQAQFPRAEAATKFRYPLVLSATIVGQ